MFFDLVLYAVFNVLEPSGMFLNFPSGPGRLCLSLRPSGDGEIRTLDPLLARQVLSQLSYTPVCSEDDRHLSLYLLNS